LGQLRASVTAREGEDWLGEPWPPGSAVIEARKLKPAAKKTWRFEEMAALVYLL